MSTALGAAGELAIRSLVERAPLASSLAQAFKAKGFTLALVGGPVRDAILGRLGNDLDFTLCHWLCLRPQLKEAVIFLSP